MSLLMENVVLAEDDIEISQMVKTYFERAYDLSVVTTDKVEKILPLVLDTKASVLIMDLELSDGDATQVLSDVADIDGLIVIILTGTWKGREENKLLKDGAQVVMRKPQKPSTIWQQVLNLRGTRPKEDRSNYRINFKGKESYYDIQEGIIIEEGGKTTYLPERKRDLMDILSLRLATDESSGGWVNSKDIYKRIFGSTKITSDLKNSFWYNMREVRKVLNDCLSATEDQDVIEKQASGRYEIYYRLNPELFFPVKQNGFEEKESA